MKNQSNKEGNEPVTKCNQLRRPADCKKYLTYFGNPEIILPGKRKKSGNAGEDKGNRKGFAE